MGETWVRLKRQIPSRTLNSYRADSTCGSLPLDADPPDRAGDEGADEIGKMLASNTTIRVLHVGHCGLESRGAKSIFDAVKGANTCLECLNLSHHFLEESAEEISGVIAANTTLKTLDLVECFLDSEGSSAVAKALSAKATLKHLDLSGNAILDQGALAFAAALDSNTSLAYLSLRNCGVTKVGAHALGTAWGGNRDLEGLIIGLTFQDASGKFLGVDEERIMHEARAHEIRKREQILAYGMVMHPRLGRSEESMSICPFHDLDGDIFKMVWEAY